MFIKSLSTLIVSFFVFFQFATAQGTWSLQKCIQYAQQNSLSVKQGENQIRQAQLSEQENRYERYPDLNGNYNAGLNFGRTIDPTTNDFTSESVLTNSLGVSAGVTLYNGGRIKNQIKQSRIDIAVAKADNEQTKNDLALSVAASYLQILLDEEQVVNANNRLAQTQAQLKQTDRLIKAGTLPQADRLEILANVARDEQSIVTQENAVEISYLNLKNILQINPSDEIRVEKPGSMDIPNDANSEVYRLKQIYNKAINTQPFIEADLQRINSANLGVEVAQSLALPVVRLFGDINSFYSNQVKEITDPGIVGPSDPEPVLIDGGRQDIQFFGPQGLKFGNRGYFNQLNDNFGQSLGINVSVPIYNRNRTTIAKERAKLNIMDTQIAAQQRKQDLKTDIQRAIATVKANKKQFEASEKTVNALEAAYTNTEKRYKLGAVNTFEYTTAKNTLDQAAIDLIVSKYNYLYSLTVIDFYQGKKLDLK